MPLPKPKLFLVDYLTSAFVETGSHRGDGIQHALNVGFPLVYSVDISPFSYGWCSHRFRTRRDRVDLYCNDSRIFLEELLPRIINRCTFWLDAHWCGGNGEMQGKDGGDKEDVPLLEELKIIRDHGIKDHIILIDDVRLLGTESFPSMETVLRSLHRINPDYRISTHNSDDYHSDILVADI